MLLKTTGSIQKKFITACLNLFSIGEEEEKAVFAYRPKLFRFDGDANQWKEKGLGEMKILQHKKNGNHYSTVTSEFQHKDKKFWILRHFALTRSGSVLLLISFV